MVMLMGLRGTPFLYYGDEIGMPDTEIPDDRVLDPVGVFHGARMGRDPERTPMHWTAEPGGGFSAPGVEPWLPYGDYARVQRRRATRRSRLDAAPHARPHPFARRAARPDAAARTRRSRPPTTALWAWRRGDHTVVACNLSDEAVEPRGRRPRHDPRVDAPARRDGDRVDGSAASRTVGSGDLEVS